MQTLIDRLRDAQAMAKLVGESSAFLKAISQLPLIAKTEVAVLISGETGTGKELVARAIHYLSERSGAPFVAVNCGSLPETLLEDELFGHERGAFTDAHWHREGLIAQAEHGTLFLDEVDTLPPKAQVDLLRVLQDKKFRPIGSTAERTADVRVVAATNVAFDQLLESDTFRTDLYYRLCVFTVCLPPLRERKTDIPLLVSHFIAKHVPANRTGTKLGADAYAALCLWDWPGNVRELENAIIRGIHLSQGDTIEAENLGLRFKNGTDFTNQHNSTTAQSFNASKREVIAVFERDYLTRLIARHEGNVSRAARTAGKDRRDLGKLLKKYELNPKSFRPA